MITITIPMLTNDFGEYRGNYLQTLFIQTLLI